MKPYIETEGTRLYLPQTVDPHKFEVCMRSWNGMTFFLLCRKVAQRYRQATGVVMERVNNELIFHKAGAVYVQRTFPLEGLETANIQIDWSAGASVSIPTEE